VLGSAGVGAPGLVAFVRPRVGWSPVVSFGSTAMLLLCSVWLSLLADCASVAMMCSILLVKGLIEVVDL